MRAVDTNVLVRLLARDDERQTRAAEHFVAEGAWVSQIVLAESTWVLGTVFGLGHAEIATMLEMLLEHERLVLQDGEVVRAALGTFKRWPKLGFTDCLVLEQARKAGCLPLGTFDKALARAEGVERLGSR